MEKYFWRGIKIKSRLISWIESLSSVRILVLRSCLFIRHPPSEAFYKI
jgi:hypothetical protein